MKKLCSVLFLIAAGFELFAIPTGKAIGSATNAQERLITVSSAVTPKPGESVVRISYNLSGIVKNNELALPLAVTMDYAKDDNSPKEFSGRLTGQIELGQSAEFAVPNGVVTLHLIVCMYNPETRRWSTVKEDGKFLPTYVPLELEGNTFIGLPVTQHLNDHTIGIIVSKDAAARLAGWPWITKYALRGF